MPYINVTDRKKYQPMINSMLALLGGNESDWIKGEMFGYFVARISHGFFDQAVNIVFNSHAFTPAAIKTLNELTDKISIEIRGSDALQSAGHLNFVISAVYWGFLGKSSQFKQASYGMRAYLTGIIEQCIQYISGFANRGNDPILYRRHLLVRGVLRDVLVETYDVCTRPYEDVKRRENGDIWVQNGTLHSAIEDTRQPHEKIRRP